MISHPSLTLLSALLLAAPLAAAAPLAGEATGIRSRPDAAAPVIGQLPPGTEPAAAAGVTAPAGWIAVEVPGPIEGYVISSDMTKSLDVKAGAPIRQAMRADSPVVATGQQGDVTRITDVSGRWSKVSIERKRIGYVRQRVIELDANTVAAPTPVAAPPTMAAPLVDTGPGRPVPSAESRATATLARSFQGKFVSTRRPLAPRRPYDYQINDGTGERFAYVDVSRLTPAEAMDRYVDRTVIITGVTRYSTEAQGLVIEAENIVVK
jgi:hypothetical protein